ncbi:MAG: hypothetical protein ACRCUQ_03810 [Alphaproteobacteria bacterium]
MLKKASQPLKSIKTVACFVSTLAWATAVFAVGENDKLALETPSEKRTQRPLSDLEQQTSAIVGEILKSLSSQDKQNLKATSKTLYDKVTAFATRIRLKDRIPLDSPFFKNLNQFKNWVEVTLGDDWNSELNKDGKHAIRTSLLNFLPEMTGIKTLYLRNNFGGILFDKTIIEALADKLPAGLEELNLMDRHIGDAGLKILAPKLPASLKTLWLHNNNIGPEGLRALMAVFPNLPNLEKLNLDIEQSIDNNTLSFIKALSKMPRFIDLSLELSISGTNDAAAVAELPAILSQTYLKNLKLQPSKLTYTEKQSLRNLKNVKDEPIKIES